MNNSSLNNPNTSSSYIKQILRMKDFEEPNCSTGTMSNHQASRQSLRSQGKEGSTRGTSSQRENKKATAKKGQLHINPGHEQVSFKMYDKGANKIMVSRISSDFSI